MNESDVHTDNRCWARFLDGDKEALFDLYGRFYHSLLFIGLKYVRDADLVKDVIQQQFLYFWEKRDHLLPAKNVRSYVIISFLRRLTGDWVKARKTVPLEVAWSQQEEEEFCETSWEETLIRRDGRNAVCKHLLLIINNLPARQRELIFMRFYEGLDYNAMVAKTGLTHRTIYNKIHEALGRIREGLQQRAAAGGLRSFFCLLISFPKF